MPSMKLYGVRWHTCTDTLPILGAVLAGISAILLTIYIILMLIVAKPSQCNTTQHFVVAWGTLALLILNVIFGVAMVWTGLKGTPFEPSKRKLMHPLMYIESVKWIVLIGWLPFAIWAVYSAPMECWKGFRQKTIIALLWSITGVVVALFVFSICSYNMLSSYDTNSRWQKRVTFLSKLMCCYNTLQSAQNKRRIQGSTPLQEIAGTFARFFGDIDIEKTDVLAGFILAEIMQVHQRRARVADALRRCGVPSCDQDMLRQLAPEGPADPRPIQSSLDSAGEDGQEAGSNDAAASHGDAQEPGPQWQREERGEKHTWESNTTYEQTAGYIMGFCECQDLKEQERGQGHGQEGGEDGHSGGDIGEECTRSADEDLPQIDVRSGQVEDAQGSGPRRNGYCSMKDGNGIGKGKQSETDHVSLNLDSPLFRWMRDISEGQNFCLTPSGWGAKLAPDLSPRECAELYTGCKTYVERPVLEEAQHWYKFAIASYGQGGFLWNVPKWFAWTSSPYWRAVAQLRCWVHPRRRVEEAAKPPVKEMLEGNRQFVKDYQGARGTSGVSDDDFVYMSFTNAALGSTPYMILLDRASSTVVLSVRGTSSYADMITDLIDRPIDIKDWVPDDFKQEHEIEGPVKAHAGMFSAAKGVLQDLNSHQILPILLTGGPHSEEEQRRQHSLHSPDSREEQAPGGQGDRNDSDEDGEQQQRQAQNKKKYGGETRGPADFQRIFAERGLDCRGWKLVITGHSLGAAIAALIGMHYTGWCRGLKVWAFNPPGGMITANLSHAMHDFVTSVIVGKDIVSRTGTVAFERLIDQVIVTLARTRLSKTRVLLTSKSKHLRKAAPEDIFCPVEEVSTEALSYVRGYFESKCKFRNLFVPMFPPGRTMQLRRLKDVKGQESWDAVWIRAEQIMEEGILLSSYQSKDHYTATPKLIFEQLLSTKSGN